MKKRGPDCARCGAMIPQREAVIITLRGALVWVHAETSKCLLSTPS